MIEIEIKTATSLQLCKIRVDGNSSIRDAKRAIEKKAPGFTIQRTALRAEPTGRELSDHELLSTPVVSQNNRLYIEDLGPQFSWMGASIIEYVGPLIMYGLLAYHPRFIYGDEGGGVTKEASIVWCCWMGHYTKRLAETLLVDRFTRPTKPIKRLIRACGYHWASASLSAYYVNHPHYTPPTFIQFVAGLVMFTIFEIGSSSVYKLLRHLRPAGTTTTLRKIPVPNANPFTRLFNYVACPQYTYEFGAWLAFALMTNCLSALIFTILRMIQMTSNAIEVRRKYTIDFSDYPCETRAIIPFVI